MESNPEILPFSSAETMAAHLADIVEAKILSILQNKKNCNLALSGGSTPYPLYTDLATRAIDWSRIQASLVDERWVPNDHSRSNEAFVRGAFSKASLFELKSVYSEDSTIDETIVAQNKNYHKDSRSPDIVILGMGTDGHTASWFPHAEGLNHAMVSDELYCSVTAKKSAITGDEVERVTMTLFAIASASMIVLMIAGDEKKKTYHDAVSMESIEDMPIRAILNARPDMLVCWAP